MADLSELAAALLGAETQQRIAGQNSYYTAQGVPDVITQSALKLAGTGNYDVGEVAATTGISSLISGLLGSYGDTHQNTLTDRYLNVVQGNATTPEQAQLSPGLFGDAQRQRQLFAVQRQLENRDIKQEQTKKAFDTLIESDPELALKYLQTGTIPATGGEGNEAIAKELGVDPDLFASLGSKEKEALKLDVAKKQGKQKIDAFDINTKVENAKENVIVEFEKAKKIPSIPAMLPFTDASNELDTSKAAIEAAVVNAYGQRMTDQDRKALKGFYPDSNDTKNQIDIKKKGLVSWMDSKKSAILAESGEGASSQVDKAPIALNPKDYKSREDYLKAYREAENAK